MENLEQVLDWLANGGGAVLAAAWAAAWLLEDWPAWHQLTSKGKKLAILTLAILLGLGGRALQLHPQLTELMRPYLDTCVIIIGAWLATQAAHKLDSAP